MMDSKELPVYWDNAWKDNPLYAVNAFAKDIQELKKENKTKILDLGCGNGSDSLFFHQIGFQVTAIDFAEKQITLLKEKYPDIAWLSRDLRDAFHAIPKQDIVYAHLSLHYFDEVETSTIFNKVFNVLNDDGLFYVKCKSIQDPLFGKGVRISENRYHYGHTRTFFSVPLMMSKLKSFKILSIKETVHPYHGESCAFVEGIAKKSLSARIEI